LIGKINKIMGNDIIDVKITDRYSKKTESSGMGCANLKPYYKINSGDIVLDLGSGSGSEALGLSDNAGESGFIFGLDLTSEMVDRANSKNFKKNVKFILGDIHALPFDDNFFNVILSNCVINHSRDKKKVFSEMYRTLKKGGYFLIGDVMAVEKLPEEVTKNPENIANCWGGAISKSMYLQIIKEAGFLNITELSVRQYLKNDFLLESIIIKGDK
jgi:arsenite methyltransferase